MSRDTGHAEVTAQTRQLLQGPLKHVQAAALAAAIVPLASVAASPAVAQTCSSGGAIGDYVWHDTNNNGLQDWDEVGFQGAVVTLRYPDGSLVVTGTYENGYYAFYDLCPGTYTVMVQIPPGTQPSPANQGGDDWADSDGVADGLGNSVAEVTLSDESPSNFAVDFGFWTPPVQQPGTATPGYWKNHPEAWPVEAVVVGGVTYSKSQALDWLWRSGPDKTLTMFASLLSAKLNVLAGNDQSCVASTIEAADAWMATYGPVGSLVRASSYAWKVGEPLHRLMDNYNNGMLCAPERDSAQ
jgi:WD40 repeat protein